MRPQKVHDDDMLKGLMSVLRAKGYDGASLNELAEAAGLKKASLYHRFPGGKKEMASAVLAYVGEWVEKNIYLSLTDKALSPEDRLMHAMGKIRELYQQGEAICIFRAMSMDTGLELFGEQLKVGIDRWVEGFTTLGVDSGMDRKSAQRAAVKTLIEIQGSLVVAKGMSSLVIFEEALQGIIKRYNDS